MGRRLECIRSISCTCTQTNEDMVGLTVLGAVVGERSSGGIHVDGVTHLPVPSETALSHLLLVVHVVVPVVIGVGGRAHGRIGNGIIQGMNGHTGLSSIAGGLQSSIESVVERVVRIAVEVQGVQLGEVHLIRAHRVQVGNCLILKSNAFFFSVSLEGSSLVTRDLEVLQVLEVTVSTVVNHPLNHSSHTLTLERTVSEHNARRTSELSQRNQRHSHGGIHVTDNLVVGVEVHIHRSGVLHLLAQRRTKQLNRRNGHSRQSNHTRVL